MKWKLTGRYIFSIVIVVISIIVINLIIGVGLLLAQTSFGIEVFSKPGQSPAQFTRDFKREIIEEDGRITITEEGKEQLKERHAWVQILNEFGEEVFIYDTPSTLPKEYTPVEIVQMYKYKEVNADTVVYIEEKQLQEGTYSYFIGVEDKNLFREMISFNGEHVERAISIGLVIFFINICIALFIGYLFSKKLTKPLYTLIDQIKELAGNRYHPYPKPRGLYKSVFVNLNSLANQLQRSEAERKRLDLMKEEWLANISHDMKTPLSSIQGYAEMMKDSDYDFSLEEMRNFAAIIEEKSFYMKDVIEDLNLSTRLKNEQLSLQKQEINIVRFVRKLIIHLLNDPTYSDRKIEYLVADEEVYIMADEILLQRAMNNLIFNAIVHNDEDVNIVVKLTATDQVVSITITDDGKGIARDDLANIFERYYHGTSTGKAHKGSGLGMAIARDIITAHDGKIGIKSELHVGTEIQIQLPVKERQLDKEKGRN